MVVPDGITPIRAYRSWCVFDGELTAAYSNVRWPIGQPMEAKTFLWGSGLNVVDPTGHYALPPRCLRSEPHLAPGDNCSCGVYALREKPNPTPENLDFIIHVHGEVELWGKVIEYECGYRAQFARVTRLWLPPIFVSTPTTDRRSVRRIAARYDVPVLKTREWKKL